MLLMGHMIGKLNKNSKILAVKYYFYVSIVMVVPLGHVPLHHIYL